MQCFRMGHFIAYTSRALFHLNIFFREILTFILNIILAFVVYLLFPTRSGWFLVVKCRHGLQDWTDVLLSLVTTQDSLWMPWGRSWPPGSSSWAWFLLRSSGLHSGRWQLWWYQLNHHSGSSARQSFFQLVAARSQCMTQATMVPLEFQNTSLHSLEGHSQSPLLPSPPLCLPNYMIKRGKGGSFLLDNSFLN